MWICTAGEALVLTEIAYPLLTIISTIGKSFGYRRWVEKDPTPLWKEMENNAADTIFTSFLFLCRVCFGFIQYIAGPFRDIANQLSQKKRPILNYFWIFGFAHLLDCRELKESIHTSEVFGTFSKLLYFIACLLATSLPVTGVVIWLNKRKKKKPARSKIRIPQAELLPN